MALEGAALAGAVLLLVLGAATCLSASNLSRRVAALFVALIGAVLGASVLGADSGALMAGVALIGAYAAIGLALLVRFQESYQSVEAEDIDAADLLDEPTEPRA